MPGRLARMRGASAAAARRWLRRDARLVARPEAAADAGRDHTAAGCTDAAGGLRRDPRRAAALGRGLHDLDDVADIREHSAITRRRREMEIEGGRAEAIAEMARVAADECRPEGVVLGILRRLCGAAVVAEQ